MALALSPGLRERLKAEARRRGLFDRKVIQAKFQDWYRGTIPESWGVPDHIRRIGEQLDRVTSGEIDRLAIHMPPRHGKSETVTIRFVLRWLELNPGKNALVTGYNERFARKFSRKIRNLAKERGMVSADKSAADEWETTSGSLVMARGVGNPPTGTGFGLIVVDDPIRRREDAESEVYREKVWDWYTDDLYSRLEPGGALVLVMTLWHEDDLGARAKASEDFETLLLPAISDDGKALWPERYPVEALERIKGVMVQNEGLRGWDALYQQNPTPREGSLFKVGKLIENLRDDRPDSKKGCRAWDLAATQDAGDRSAGCRIDQEGAGAERRFWITDAVFGKWSADERNRRMLYTAKIDGTSVTIRLPQDPGQAGKEQAKQMTARFAGYPVKTLPVTGSKEVRAQGLAAQIEAGNVYMVRAPWNAALIEELRAFPSGKHDDIVDALSDAFNELALFSNSTPTHRNVPESKTANGRPLPPSPYSS